MDKFESTINQIRDILRKEGITGMDSIKHCLLFMFMKFLSESKCIQLGIDSIYSFEQISELTDEIEIKSRVFVKSKPCLVNFLKTKNIFNIDYKLNSNANLKIIIRKIAQIDLAKLSLKTDIVGIIYELHLKSGTSQAMRDLGQYFTNREVIEWMVKLTNPKITNKKTGEIEKVLDPSMGTGGFITMAIKHLNDTNNKIDWTTNKNNIYGFDIDENVTQMSLLNAFIETGLLFDKTIIKHDSLHKDYMIDNETLIDKVDVILANEPFGLKNITYTECCERIKELKIKGTKAEPLFLQLMMLSLNPGGRCAIVVPDGVLFNDSNLHTGTREYLVENLNLKKVTSLNGDFFLNTGVKSSILYFVNDGKTNQVEFSELVISNNLLKENIICKVGYKDIVINKYSLFINKYNTIEEKKLDGIKYMKIEDICDFLPKSKKQSSYGKDNGKYPFYTSSQELTKYCDEFDYIDECLILGTGGNANIKFNKKFSCSADNFIIKSSSKNVINKYVYYYLKVNIEKLSELFHGATIKHLSKNDLEKLQIPIPSINIQRQIVEILDLYHEQIERNVQSIKAYESIKKSIIWTNTINCTNINKLGDILTVKQGDYITKENETVGTYGVYGGGDATYYINKFNRENKVVIAKDGVSEKCVRIIKNKFFMNHHAWSVEITNKNVNENFVNYWLWFIQNKIYNLASGSAQKGINQKNFLQLEIPIPTSQVQESIIKECEYWNEQIDQLKIKNEKLKAVPLIELCLASESVEPTKQTKLDEKYKSDEEEYIKSESESEEKLETVEIEIKNKTYIRIGTNVYIKTKKGKTGELFGTWNASTGKVKKITPKEIKV